MKRDKSVITIFMVEGDSQKQKFATDAFVDSQLVKGRRFVEDCQELLDNLCRRDWFERITLPIGNNGDDCEQTN